MRTRVWLLPGIAPSKIVDESLDTLQCLIKSISKTIRQEGVQQRVH